VVVTWYRNLMFYTRKGEREHYGNTYWTAADTR